MKLFSLISVGALVLLVGCTTHSAPQACHPDTDGLYVISSQFSFPVAQSEHDVIERGYFLSPRNELPFWEMPQFTGTPTDSPGDIRTVVVLGEHRYAFNVDGTCGSIDGCAVRYSDEVTRWYRERVLPIRTLCERGHPIIIIR